jgi:repressor LexA
MATDRERDVYDFVRRYTRRHGVAPKLREIATHLGISSRGVVHRYLKGLEAEGLIEIDPDRARGVRLTSPASRSTARTLPVLGRVAAGRPIEAIPDESEIDLSQFFTGPNRFVLRVAGDSMIEAGILHDDVVIVESQSTARTGDIVVALIDREEATLKYFRRNPDGSITLTPANRAMRPMRFPAARVAIQGVVVGQLRSYV